MDHANVNVCKKATLEIFQISSAVILIELITKQFHLLLASAELYLSAD